MSHLRIAHLSDPHFGTILPGVLDGLLTSLQELKPDLVLLTGDITQRARRRQFHEAKEFTHRLKPWPVIAVPGNHDIPLYNLPARLFFPYRGFQKLFKDQLEKDFVFGDATVIGLNTTSRWRHVQGEFDLDHLERRLASVKAGTKVKIAAFHHPLDCIKPSDEKNLLVNRVDSMRLFEKHGVDLIVGGHIHDPYCTLSTVRYPEIKRTMVIGVAGTCSSWRIRPGAPNSFNLIDINTEADPHLTVSRFDQRENKRFELERTHKFVRDGGAWHPR